MKTTGTNEVIELTEKQKLACNLIISGALILCALILLLVGVRVIKVKIGLIVTPVILGGIGISLFVTALIQRNTVSMWLSGVLLSCMTATIVAVSTKQPYAVVYPIFIASPAIASLMTIFISESKNFHGSIIVFFGILSILFSLNSSGTLSWYVSTPLIVMFFGITILLYSIMHYRNKDKEE